jgi:hypothetical protein
MPSVIHNFNDNSKSWKIHAYNLESITGDDLNLTAANNQNINLNVSGGLIKTSYLDVSNNLRVYGNSVFASDLHTDNSSVKIPNTYSNYAFTSDSNLLTNLTKIANTWIDLSGSGYKVNYSPLSDKSKVFLHGKINYIASAESEQFISFQLLQVINNSEKILFSDMSLGSVFGVIQNGIYNFDYVDSPDTSANITYYLKYKISDDGNNIDVSSGVLGYDNNNINCLMAQELYIPSIEGLIQTVNTSLGNVFQDNRDASFNNVSINNVLEVSNNLLVLGDASINNNLEVSNDLLVLGDASINNVSCGNLTIDNINIDGNRITNDITLLGTTTETLYKIVATTLNNQNSGQSKQIVHDIRSNFDGTDDLRYRIRRTGKLGDSDEFHVTGFDTIKLYGSTDTTDNNWGRGLQVYAKARFHNGTNGTSDDRLKFNERSINNSLNIIRQLNPLIYERSDNFNDASNLLYTEAGLIAQAILEISDLSYCVIGGDYYDISNNLIQNAYALDYNSLFIYNIAATKELDAIVQVQETKISNLEAENTLLKSKLNEILIEMGKVTI